MTTAIDIIQDSLESIGEYAPGETITAADALRGLKTLNLMLDLWSNQNLACFNFLTQSVLLVNQQASYSIGPTGADVTGPRPLKLEQVYLVDTNGNKYNVRDRTRYDFNIITSGQVTSQVPTDAYYEPSVPNGLLTFWPTPVEPLYTAYWTSFAQLTQFPDLYDPVEMPTGYDAAMRPNLAVLLCKYFGKDIPPSLAREAVMALGILKRKNAIKQESYYDPALVARPDGGWNVLSGQWNARSN